MVKPQTEDRVKFQMPHLNKDKEDFPQGHTLRKVTRMGKVSKCVVGITSEEAGRSLHSFEGQSRYQWVEFSRFRLNVRKSYSECYMSNKISGCLRE